MSVSLNNLLCYYNFDTSSNYTLVNGTSIFNYATGLNDLSYNGTAGIITVSTTQKKTGTGALYSSTNPAGSYYKFIPRNLITNNGFTFACWVYLTTSAGHFFFIGNNIGLYMLGLNYGSFCNKGVTIEFSSGGTANTWSHITVVAVYNAGTTTLKYYVNGVKSTTTTFVGTNTPLGGSGGTQSGCEIQYSGDILSGSDTAIYIGGHPSLTVFPSYIDEVLLFNRVLSASEITALYNLNYSVPLTSPPYPCFLQGTKILRMNVETDAEEYVPVETLRRNDLIKTVRSGYKAIQIIGHKLIHNHPNSDLKNRLFIYKKSPKIPELFEDLCVTGEHCSLLYDVPEEKLKAVEEYMGRIYVTEGDYRVPAHLDDRAEPYPETGPATIWHFALEHDDPYANYGVFANGLLVESSSIWFMTELAGMQMAE